MKTLVLTKTNLFKKSIITVMSIALCIVLPQFFHLLGYFSGLNTSLGVAFLPMHLAVIFVGLFFGKNIGLVCGIFSPIISYYLTGMPLISSIPLMTLELTVYGLFAGILSNKPIPTFSKVLITQIIGRILKVSAIYLLYFFEIHTILPSDVWLSTLSGLPGIILQLTLLPLLLYRLEH